MRLAHAVAILLLLTLARPAPGDAFELDLPPGFPPPLVPADNPMTTAKVELGERLFHDTRLSVTGAYSCASCHDPAREFTDGRARAVGATGELHARNTPSLINVAYNASLGWIDLGLTNLERQHAVPLTGTEPLEMGFGEVQARALADDPELEARFRDVFGAETIGLDTVTRALASYVRTLIRADSPFDRYLMWDERAALDESARAGMTLFFSQELGCSGCHASFNLSGPVRHADFEGRPGTGVDAAPVFHVNGVGGSPLGYRAPSLRNVGRTAPYMHDGSIATLDDVLSFYATGGAERLPGFALRDADRAALIRFLEAL